MIKQVREAWSPEDQILRFAQNDGRVGNQTRYRRLMPAHGLAGGAAGFSPWAFF